MSDHPTPRFERHVDVAVVGGSAAGLAAALQLVRQRRSVFVVDSGTPRNAPAAHMHGFLGHDGLPPGELLAIARTEVRSYGGEVVPGRVDDAERLDDGRLRLHLTGGHAVVARRVLVATGLVDELPPVEGLAERWGRDVVHCPFCHGFEVRDQRVVQLVTHPMGLHPTVLFRQLTERLTLVVAADVEVDEERLSTLELGGVRVVRATATRLVVDDDRVVAVELADGTRIDADVVAVGPRFRARTEPFASIGLTPLAHPSGLGDHLAVAANGATDVPGVFAAGNVADPSQQVLHAAANGSWVGAMIAFELAEDDLARAVRHAPNEADWDHRYSGDRVWSGNPNGSMVHEVTDLEPGRALDVGAGEGGDAVWLAERGWRVTATDVSARAVDRIAAEAARRGLDLVARQIDANAPAAFDDAAFDLVSAQYASIPRTPDDRAVLAMMRAVAPGGRLLVVSHDLEPMRTPLDPAVGTRMFDPDAYVRVDDIARVVADDPSWTIEVHERRPRPPGAASSHHVDDVVFRARRER